MDTYLNEEMPLSNSITSCPGENELPMELGLDINPEGNYPNDYFPYLAGNAYVDEDCETDFFEDSFENEEYGMGLLENEFDLEDLPGYTCENYFKSRRCFLVDLENVQSAGLDGIESLNEYETVIIFYSENANMLSVHTCEALMHTSAHIEFKKRVGTGKNALDFQLSAYLGQLIERNHEEYSEFYIVARDQGYKSVTEFLNQSLPKKLVLQIRDIRSA